MESYQTCQKFITLKREHGKVVKLKLKSREPMWKKTEGLKCYEKLGIT